MGVSGLFQGCFREYFMGVLRVFLVFILHFGGFGEFRE